MGTLQDIVFFAIFLGVLVTVHELGHFLAAKWAGVKVEKFSVGLGPRVVSFRRGETEYQVALLPLGGFVKMAGQYPGDEEGGADALPLRRTFLGAPWWKRMVILAAGPAFNLIFPVFAYTVAFVGDREVVAPRVAWVEPGYPAAAAGMQPGDLVKRIDGKPIRAFDQIRPSLEGVFERPVEVVVEREGQEVVLQITPRKNEETTVVEKVKRGLLGISALAQPTVVGVPADSPAWAAGLRTFDRVLSVNGQVVDDELKLARLLDHAAAGPLEVVVVRSALKEVGNARLVMPALVTVRLDKQPGRGLAALGVESGSLYAWAVFPGSPAAKAGLKVGDRLLTLGGAELRTWISVQQALKAADRGTFEVTWRSGQELKSAKVSQVAEDVLDELKNKSEVLEFGVRPRPAFQAGEVLAAGPALEKVVVHLGLFDAAKAAVQTVPKAVRDTAIVMGKLFTREISTESVGGPILLFQVAAMSAEAGYETFLQTMALVSVNLGLVNLLPIPILDGFGLLAALWEGVRRRPIPPRAREVANMIGFAMLALLVVLVMTNDITKLLR